MSESSKANVYALITGGCSGIGFEYARKLAAKQYDILIISNEGEKNEDACKRLTSEFAIKAVSFDMDLSRVDAAEEIYAFCRKNQYRIEILINNAGIFFFKQVTEIAPELIDKILMIQVVNFSKLCSLFAQEMKVRQSGYILTTSSITAWMPFPGIGIYSAAKRYIKDFSRALRYELKGDNIVVSIVCPGAVDTGLYHFNEKYRRLLCRLHIMMTPEKLATKAIDGMFRHRFQIIPGFFTGFFRYAARLLPPPLIYFIKRKSKLYN